MGFEILRVQPDTLEEFYRKTEREALKFLYDFNVVWHEQTYDLAAIDGSEVIGAARIRVAASLAHIERLIVLPERRRNGVGRALLVDAAELGNYYNCHKMTVMVPYHSAAQRFFEACEYKEEAVLPQHTFKLDVAVLRKFLL